MGGGAEVVVQGAERRGYLWFVSRSFFLLSES